MEEHIDILLLLDYAQGKILNDDQRDPITDHLCECGFCRQILKSHYYLIHNHEILLEKFFPEPDPLIAEVSIPETSMQTGLQLSVSQFLQSIHERIQSLKNQGTIIGQEIRVEVIAFLDEIRSISGINSSLVPLKVENIALLGIENTEKDKDQKFKYLSHNIKLNFLSLQDFKAGDFEYRFTGKYFYINYNLQNFYELNDRKVHLITDIGSPFIFTGTFKETFKSSAARIKIEFDEILPFDASPANEEAYYDFFLTID